jgi:hypothetical protein
VVVEAGLTETELPVTVPTDGEMDSEVAPVADQARVEEPPAVMLAGDAVKLAMVGGATGVTVTVVEAVAEPSAFVAVRV